MALSTLLQITEMQKACMIQAHHQPHTSHTTNPVPFIMITNELKDSNAVLPLTQLSNIAPFILKNLGLPIPKEMEKRQ